MTYSNVARLLAAVVALSVLQTYAVAREVADAAQLERRREIVLSKLIANGPSERNCVDDDLRKTCNVLRPLAYALGALYRASSAQEIAAGNATIAESTSILFKVLRGDRGRALADNDKFTNSFLVPINLLSRTYFLFGDTGTKRAGALSKENQQQYRELVWEFARARCLAADADAADTWKIRGSENLHLMQVAICWAAGEVLAGEPALKYGDGSTPSAQRAAWTAYLKEYIRQRAKFGGLIEFFSHYYKYTLLNIYNFAEFSPDPKLRELSTAFLDVWFADWAEEQIGGVHGGSKARIYFTQNGKAGVGSELGWLYFDLGTMQPSATHPALISMVTSSYQPPELVAKIATDVVGRGAYEVWSRRPGLRNQTASAGSFRVDAAVGGILRYTYVSPSFVMGTSVVVKHSLNSWFPGSAQNHWNGLILSGSLQRYLFASPVNIIANGEAKSIYNSEWGVQYKGTQIVQKTAAPYSNRSGNMVVWFGDDLKPERDGDWIFFNSSAYVAVRSAYGSLTDRAGSPRGYSLTDDFSPVIVHAASHSDYPNFADFKRAVLSAELSIDAQAVRFRAPRDAATITFFYASGRLPEINNAPINPTPSYAFSSPFIQAKWGEGLITIRMGSKQIVRDFKD